MRVALFVGILLACSLLVASLYNSAFAQENGTIEYAEKETGPVATYTASDPEGASVRWSLGGVDAGDFTIEDGVLRFAKTPNYEKPMGGGTTNTLTNTYVVDVLATDETRRMETETVTVEVTNVDEAGKVTLSARRAPVRHRVHRRGHRPRRRRKSTSSGSGPRPAPRTGPTGTSRMPRRRPTRRRTPTPAPTCAPRPLTKTMRARARRR